MQKKNISNKIANYKLTNQITRGVIKLNNETTISSHFIIKIIGIWESNKEYGLTYKITNHR